MEDLIKLGGLISTLSGPTMMGLFIVLNMRGVIVWSREMREVRAQLAEAKTDLKDYRSLALTGTRLAETLAPARQQERP